MSNFWMRAITGVVFVLILSSAFIGGIVMTSVLFFMVMLIGHAEYSSILTKGKMNAPSGFVSMLIATGVYWSIVLVSADYVSLKWLSLSILLLVLIPFIELWRGVDHAFSRISNGFAAQLWITMPFASLPAMTLTSGTYEAWIPLGFFMLLWTNDTGAYLTGRSIGKHKLAPTISPGKTIEGFAGGVLLAMLLAWFMPDISETLRRQDWMIIAIIISVFSNAGDLVESLLKRNAGVKDSGKILPGHGGVLDRFDGVLLSVPLILAYLLLVN